MGKLADSFRQGFVLLQAEQRRITRTAHSVGRITAALSLALLLALSTTGSDEYGGGARPTEFPSLKSPPIRQPRPKYIPGELLVRFKPETPKTARKYARDLLGARLLRAPKIVPGLEHIQLPEGLGVEKAISRYRENPDVLYAEPNYVIHVHQTPSDSLFTLLWGLHNTGQDGGTPDADIDAPEAWNLGTGSSEIVVAVIDTGIDYTHPDLAANMYRNESECTPNGLDDDGNGYIDDCYGISTSGTFLSDPMDDMGHGTHVAGTIGAVGDNGKGVVGVNWNVKLLPCKLIGLEFGIGNAVDCLEYVRKMKERGVNIVATNNSWGLEYFSESLLDAIEAQQQLGILFIASAGNDFRNNDEQPVYPANFPLPNIISVAATDRNDNKAAFSNMGSRTVDIGAPGVDVLSTVPNGGYAFSSGTSMSAPHVAGVAALLKAANPNRTWQEIKNLILAGGDAIPSMAETVTGKRLNAYGALTCAGTPVERRLTPVEDTIAATVGGSVDLEVLHINCAMPDGNLDVTVEPTHETLTLVDDGTGADRAAADGVYSGRWSPAARGSYTLYLPNNEDVDVQVLEGYRYDKPDFAYRQIGGTNLNLEDDEVAQITSPFSLGFGGGSFTQLNVSSNGTLSFTDFVPEFSGQPLPVVTRHVVTLVALFWDDLLPVPETDQNVFWAITGTAPNRELVVEWRNVRGYQCLSPDATVTFQVVFSENSSDIRFNYADTVFGGDCDWRDRGASATIGVQVSPDSAALLTYGQATSYSMHGNEIVDDSTTILWTLDEVSPVLNPVPQLTSLSPTTADLYAPEFVLTVQGRDFVRTSAVQFGGALRATTFISNTELHAVIAAADLGTYAKVGPVSVQVVNPAPGGGESNPVTFTINPPEPTITQIDPDSVVAGDVSFRLTADGNNFYSGSTLLWDGQARNTSFINRNQVLTAIPASDIASPGTVEIRVDNDGRLSNAVVLTITAAVTGSGNVSTDQAPLVKERLTLQTPPPAGTPYKFLGWNYARRQDEEYYQRFLRAPGETAIPVASSPSTPYHDGKPDSLLSSVAGTPPEGLPGFQLRDSLPAGFLPSYVAVGDFNQDSSVDWAVTNAGDNTLWLYFGRGDGTSEIPRIIPLAGGAPVWVEAADLRNNGLQDLVIAYADSASVGVLLGQGDGTFAPEQTYLLPAPPLTLEIQDFDGDTHLDVLAGVISSVDTGPVILLPGTGTGDFGSPVYLGDPITYFWQIVTFWIDSADLDGDGDLDLAIVDVSISRGGVWIYLNGGDGTFKPFRWVYDGYIFQALSVALGQLDDDGCPDLVFNTANTVTYILKGNCDGTFEGLILSQKTFVNGNSGVGLALGDVNGDGHTDVVSSGVVLGWHPIYGQEAGHLLSVSLNDGHGHFSRPRLYRGDPSAFGLALVDLNGDNALDAVTANQDSDTTTVFLNDGSGAFGFPEGLYIGYGVNGASGPLNTPITPLQPVDVNGDGALDLALIEYGEDPIDPYSLSLLLNDGTGRFSAPLRTPAAEGEYVSSFALEDFRHTGLLDFVALAQPLSEGNSFLFYGSGHGDGTFTTGKEFATLPGQQMLVRAGEFNGDGHLDIVAAGLSGSPLLTVFLGNGDGTFVAQPSIYFGSGLNTHYPRQLFVSDFNSDGKQDVIIWIQDNLIGNINDGVYQFLGNGDGTFQAPQILFPDFNPMTMVDVNEDGRLDILGSETTITDFTQPPFPEISVYLGRADGSFAPPTSYSPYSGWAVSVSSWMGYLPFFPADLNGDGYLDIFVLQQTRTYPARAYIQILMGHGDGTFSPTFHVYNFHKLFPPQSAADVTGDGRADVIELNGLNSSFHIMPSEAAPGFDVTLLTPRLVGTTGLARVSLSLPSPAETTLTLSSSDPAVTVPASVTIPPDTVAQEFEFSIGAGFSAPRTFEIRAELGSETATALGMTASTEMPIGLFGELYLGNFTFLPGQTITRELSITSIGNYASRDIRLSCSAAPPLDLTCTFPQSIGSIPADGYATTTVELSIGSSTPAGTHLFTIDITDGEASTTIYARLPIGDFRLDAGPPTKVALTTGSGEVPLTTTIINGEYLNANIEITCTGLPAGANCQPTYGTNPSPAPLVIDTNQVAVGDYNFTIVGTAETLSQSTPGVLAVGDFGLKVIDSSSAVLPTGTIDYQLDISSINGFAGSVQTSCSGLPSGTRCSVQHVTLPVGQIHTLTLSTDETPPGTYPFIVEGALGSVNHTASGELRVAGFNGSLSPTSATVNVGGTRTFDVTVSSVNEFSETVSFDCLNPPSGITCTFDPASAQLPADGSLSSQLTVAVSQQFAVLALPVPDGVPPPSLWLLYITLLCAAAAWMLWIVAERTAQGRTLTLRTSLAALLLLGLLASSACGGGGSSAAPRPPSGSGTTSRTVTLNIQASSRSLTRQIGTITLTVQR
jgi:hypothetical protein